MKKKFILCAVAFLIALSPMACAVENDIFDAQYQALELNKLERSASSHAVEKIDENISFQNGLNTLWKRFAGEFTGIFRRGLKSAAGVLLIAVLCAVVMTVHSSKSTASIPDYIIVAGVLAITCACAGNLHTMIGMGKSSIEEVNSFSKALLPSLSAAVAASGIPLSATAGYTATVVFADVLINVVANLLFPLVYAYIAVSAADAAVGNGTLARIADFIKWIASTALKVLLTVFVTYLSISGLLASTTDMLGTKTAKVAVSGAIPVVGGVIADATETVIAGAMVMKNAIGVFGMLTILSVCLTPFITLGVNFFVFKASAAICAPMVDGRLAKLVDNISTAFGIVLGMSASCALLMFLSILNSMYAVGAV